MTDDGEAAQLNAVEQAKLAFRKRREAALQCSDEPTEQDLRRQQQRAAREDAKARRAAERKIRQEARQQRWAEHLQREATKKAEKARKREEKARQAADKKAERERERAARACRRDAERQRQREQKEARRALFHGPLRLWLAPVPTMLSIEQALATLDIGRVYYALDKRNALTRRKHRRLRVKSTPALVLDVLAYAEQRGTTPGELWFPYAREELPESVQRLHVARVWRSEVARVPARPTASPLWQAIQRGDS